MKPADGDAMLFDEIAAELVARERSVREADPALPEPEILDRALRQSLVRFRHDVSVETFAYLRWRVEQLRAAAQLTCDVSAARRLARLDARSPDDVRRFVGSDGFTWRVQEMTVGVVPWARGPRCLLFQSEAAVRRVWHYPADWRALADDELEALGWST